MISPLIALMEDQTAALGARGLRAARIHSGRPRSESRQACLDWVEGKLDFLYVAPERLRVPGFVEWLARRKPGLIAIDEAHCISQWGHDFRPDYRLLGSRLPALRPAPLIALTATATPQVQRDITEQLAMKGAKRLIHGFRRDNLAVDVIELNPGARRQRVKQLLADGGRLPAIVYVPSRKECGALSAELAGQAPCMPYHAGLEKAQRERAQQAFMDGSVPVIVATIAFGMGIDKADIRTVIHTALPQSVEGYYQEIGRAGRDGNPSRALLMYSWSDRRIHEFFLDRDYPPEAEIGEVFNALGKSGRSVGDLCSELDLDEATISTRLERLLAHGGAEYDGEQSFVRGKDGWQGSYRQRVAHRRRQIDLVFEFAQARGCRMCALVRHFGDSEDDGRPCGHCDNCAPARGLGVELRAPDAREGTILTRIMGALLACDDVSTGKLYRENFEEHQVPRREFELHMAALEQAKLLYTVPDEFEKNGEVIRYRRAVLTDAGRKSGGKVDGLVKLAHPARAAAGRKARSTRATVAPAAPAEEHAPPDAALVEALKGWRRQQADKEGVRAFHVFSNRVLDLIARKRPRTVDELLSVPGVGAQKQKKYGSAILLIVPRG